MKAFSINKCRCRWKKCKCLYSKECVPWQVWPINLSNKDLCFSLGNKLLQEATDAFTLFADAKTELNHWHRGLIKPDLHDDCKRLCSSSRAIIDWLFGDDLQKHIKDLTEVNPIDKKGDHKYWVVLQAFWCYKFKELQIFHKSWTRILSDLKAKNTTTNTQAPRTNSNRRQSRGSQSRESGSCFWCWGWGKQNSQSVLWL